MKYIDAEKLKAEIERLTAEHSSRYEMDEAAIVLDKLEDFITSLQQEQPVTKEPISHLEHWLAFFGCPEENIEKCATQIAQGYGAIRYLEGVQNGAEAVNELAQQEQPEVDLDKETIIDYVHNHYHYDKDFDGYGHSNLRPVFTREDLIELVRHFYELGLNARK